MGAAVLAVARKAEEVRAKLSQSVRRTEFAESSRAEAVVGAQQLLAQASVVDAPPAYSFVHPCVVSGAGGSQ